MNIFLEQKADEKHEMKMSKETELLIYQLKRYLLTVFSKEQKPNDMPVKTVG